MKKIFTLLVALVATTALWAYSFSVGGIYYNILSNNEVEVSQSPSDYTGSVTIPKTVTYSGITYSVTSIGWDAFALCSSLTSVTIPNSVTSIGWSAFSGCSGLTSISIPNSVTSIGWSAFSGCSGLTSITIPNSVTSIGEGVFNATGIYNNEANWENGVLYISNCLIEAKNDISGAYIIKEGTRLLAESAFRYCSSLTSISIPNSVTSIGYGAFSRCSGLTSITIPNSVTSIGEDVFNATGIYNNEANWENDVLYISNCLIEAKNDISGAYIIKEGTRLLAEWAFSECTGLTSVTIPNSVTSIGWGAFEGCSKLTSITIPNSVTSIGGSAFDGCSGLTSVTIGNSVTSIGGWAFYKCTGLTSVNVWAEVPPTLGTDVFYNVSTRIPVYVPCGSVSAYQSAEGWKAFTNIQGPLAEYSIAVGVNDNKMGTAKVDENTICGAQISATANYGYHFTQWSDGNTENPRSLILTQDTTLTAEFAPNQYAITTTSSQPDRGTTRGDTMVNYLEYATLSAEANYGYHFENWNDGNTDNPRSVLVTEYKTYTAYFAKNTYSITKNCNSEQGYIDGVSSAKYLDRVTLTATPNYGYHFTKWSDGNIDNPRSLVLTQDTTFTAEFAVSYSGQCGDNLYWAYDETTKTISITGSGDMYDYTKATQPWYLFQEQITEVTTSNTTTGIGTSAFEGYISLGKLSIGSAMKNIAADAFAGCNRLYDIYCYAYPPFAEESSFANYNVYVYIPCEYQRDYMLDVVWGKFKYIECIGAESDETDGDNVTITPGSNDVTITWPTDSNAETYVIVIKQADKVFCTLTFNKDGMLLNIAFAPSRSGSHPVTYATSTGNGLRFTVTSLDAATTYGYDITTKDEEDNTLSTYTGEFTTKSNVSTSVSDIQSPMTDCQKLIRDGQLVIVRDGKTYNAMGVEM